MIRGSFLSICSDALALHEITARQYMTLQAQSGKSQTVAESQQELASVDDYLPTVDDLIIADGVARIPIHGIMVKRSQIWCGWFSSRVIVGSDHWATVISDLIQRNDIETIVLDFETGGGQVAGTERLGDAIWKARQSGKTVIAVVNEFCASAGLWAASQSDRIVIPSTGSIGSLGVYTLHFDETKWLADIGIEKSVIYRGAYKAIDERPLDADGKADLQRFIDGKYSSFVDAVARGRGLTPEEVTQRWGDSRLFTGTEAVSNGLADEIGTLQDVLDSLKAGRGGRVSIDPPADECDPETDPEGDPEAMVKLNATGQILDAAGKVVGNISELQIDAAGVTKYFASQSGELIESAVKTAQAAAAETQKAAVAEAEKASHSRLDELVAAVGAEKAIAAFKAGHSVEKAKAGLADDLAAQLRAKDEEIAKLKSGGGTSDRAPAFVASDAGGSGDGKPPAKTDVADKDAPFAADWNSNKDGCQDKFPSLQAYAALQRYEARRAG